MECGLDNITACFIDALEDWLKDIINAPLHLFLSFIEHILSTAPSISSFGSLWTVIVTLISVFYGILILAAGINFMVSGSNATKREYAKQWLQNILIMIVLIQSSYLIYSLAGQIAHGLSSGMFNLINNSFFEVQLNFHDIATYITMGGFYMTTLFITSMLLSAVYALASMGVVLCPIGILFYFIPPLRDFGKFILSTLGVLLSIPFVSSIILVAGSFLSETSTYSGFHLVLAISCFMLVNLTILALLLFAMIRSITTALRIDLVKSIVFLKGGIIGRK
ncbi:hypothetical protein GF373_17910 [bacterium]|nr:hypothetical protein [bacterium]